MFRKLMLALVALLVATIGFTGPAQAATASDAIVSVGTTTSTVATQTINGTLYTVDQIGVMADRILYTEEQIGVMADRIVYVTELAMDGSVQVIYLVTALVPTGTTSTGQYSYQVWLTPIAALPTGW